MVSTADNYTKNGETLCEGDEKVKTYMTFDGFGNMVEIAGTTGR